MNKMTTWAASRIVHQAWLLISVIGLTAAWQIEPYAFAYATLGTLALSALLVINTLITALETRPLQYRGIATAVTSTMPSLISCLVLITVSWA